jgi:hypothetical protein
MRKKARVNRPTMTDIVFYERKKIKIKKKSELNYF